MSVARLQWSTEEKEPLTQPKCPSIASGPDSSTLLTAPTGGWRDSRFSIELVQFGPGVSVPAIS
jgi:hypothetical protein